MLPAPEYNLPQAAADALIASRKRRVDARQWDYPGLGGAATIPLLSADRRERFFLDLRRSRIDYAKGTYQNRGRQVVVLVRLDFGGRPHRNPDGNRVESPHLHLYREGYGAKWAFPVPGDRFRDVGDRWQTLEDFMDYCNIVDPPFIRWSQVT